MNVQTLVNDLRHRRVQPVYLILGNHEYLSRLIRKSFVNLIPDGQRAMNFAEYDTAVSGLGTILNDITSAPFLGQHRLVFVDHPDFLTGESKQPVNQRDVNELVKYLKRPLTSTVLVLFLSNAKLDGRKKLTRVIRRTATIVNFNYFSGAQATRYVSNVIKHRGFRISSANLNLLIQRTDGQLSTTMNELPKLLLYCYHTKVISADAINSLVTKSLNQNVFDLVNDVLKRRITSAVDLYHELVIRGQQPLQINAILVSQFRLLLQVMILSRDGYSQGGLAKMLRVNPFRVRIALRSIRQFTLGQLAAADLGLIKMEVKMKSTDQSPELLFELFMLKFTAKKNDRVN